MKSNIVLLTFSTSKKKSDIVESKFHEKVNPKDFIHKCYIECARIIYDSPELFWHQYPTIEIKRNQREICELIGKAIREAIRKTLPIKPIIQEYLENDYHSEEDQQGHHMSDSQYMAVKEMVKRDIHGGNYSEEDEGYDEDDNNSRSRDSRDGSYHSYDSENDNSDVYSDRNLLDDGIEDKYDNEKIAKDVFTEYRENAISDDIQTSTHVQDKLHKFVSTKPLTPEEEPKRQEGHYSTLEQASSIPPVTNDIEYQDQPRMLPPSKRGSSRNLNQMMRQHAPETVPPAVAPTPQVAGSLPPKQHDSVLIERNKYFANYLK